VYSLSVHNGRSLQKMTKDRQNVTVVDILLPANCSNRAELTIYMHAVECVQAHKISEQVHDINLLGLHGEAIGKVRCKGRVVMENALKFLLAYLLQNNWQCTIFWAFLHIF